MEVSCKRISRLCMKCDSYINSYKNGDVANVDQSLYRRDLTCV